MCQYMLHCRLLLFSYFTEYCLHSAIQLVKMNTLKAHNITALILHHVHVTYTGNLQAKDIFFINIHCMYHTWANGATESIVWETISFRMKRRQKWFEVFTRVFVSLFFSLCFKQTWTSNTVRVPGAWKDWRSNGTAEWNFELGWLCFCKSIGILWVFLKLSEGPLIVKDCFVKLCVIVYSHSAWWLLRFSLKTLCFAFPTPVCVCNMYKSIETPVFQGLI